MRKEKLKIKTHISNVENMEDVEKEIEALKERQISKPIPNNIENNVMIINTQLSQIGSNYEGIVRDNYNFIASLNCTDKSYELVESSLDIHFRKIIYEGIIAFISVTPIIAVQILGIIYNILSKKVIVAENRMYDKLKNLAKNLKVTKGDN